MHLGSNAPVEILGCELRGNTAHVSLPPFSFLMNTPSRSAANDHFLMLAPLLSAQTAGAILSNSSRCDLVQSRVQSNYAKMLGGSIVVWRGSVINLLDSVFEFNFAANRTATDGVGIMNYDGQVQCDTEHCMSACTTCQDDLVSPRPTWQPTSPRSSLQPTVATVSKATQKERSIIPPWVMMVASLIGMMIVTGSSHWMRLRFQCQYRAVECAEQAEEQPAEQAEEESSATLFLQTRHNLLAGPNSTDGVSESKSSIELCHASRFLLSSYASSPAPIFVIGRSDMDIIIDVWSTGMASTVPMQVDPVGWLITDLPYANARDGLKLHKILADIFGSPADYDNTRPFMLHLRTKNGAVLLEMRLTMYDMTPKPFIVMTGREVESHLFSLIASEDESVVTASENIHTPEPAAVNENVPVISTSPEDRTGAAKVPVSLSIIESSPTLIFAVDRDLRIVSWSPGACTCRVTESPDSAF